MTSRFSSHFLLITTLFLVAWFTTACSGSSSGDSQQAGDMQGNDTGGENNGNDTGNNPVFEPVANGGTVVTSVGLLPHSLLAWLLRLWNM